MITEVRVDNGKVSGIADKIRAHDQRSLKKINGISMWEGDQLRVRAHPPGLYLIGRMRSGVAGDYK